MKKTLRRSVLIIIAGLVIGVIAGLPMIINKNDSFIVPGVIISTLAFLIGIINILRVLFSNE